VTTPELRLRRGPTTTRGAPTGRCESECSGSITAINNQLKEDFNPPTVRRLSITRKRPGEPPAKETVQTGLPKKVNSMSLPYITHRRIAVKRSSRPRYDATCVVLSVFVAMLPIAAVLIALAVLR
jgi:hypothetical protein